MAFRFVGVLGFRVSACGSEKVRAEALTLNPRALLGPAPSVAFGNTGAHGNRYRNPIVGAPVDKACY